MHSLWLTGRLLSRAIWNGISNLSSAADPNVQRKTDPHIISAVCGFPKERVFKRLIKGQFGDDAWFSAKSKSADVLGQNRDITFDMCIARAFINNNNDHVVPSCCSFMYHINSVFILVNQTCIAS